MLLQLVRLKRAALGLLSPNCCLGCGREGGLICPSCRQKLSFIQPPLCPQCGIPQPGGMLCPARSDRNHVIDGIRLPFRFKGVTRQPVHQLKYRNLRAAAEPLGELLAEYLNANPIDGDVMVPVPLHGRRLRERGYNHSGLLVQELGKISRLPVVEDCLIRRRDNSTQAKSASASQWQPEK